MNSVGRSQLTKDKDTLVVKIANHLGEKILNGDIPPDTRLKILDLTATYHVSQMIIRDALSLMGKWNIVSVTARKGYYVRSFSGAEILELWDIYKRLWGLAIRQYCREAQKNPELSRRFAEAARAVTANQVTGMAAIKQASEFLMSIHHHCGNAILQDMLLNLEYPICRLRWQLFRAIGPLSEEDWAPILLFRNELCRAICENRPGNAEQLMLDAADAEILILSKVLDQIK